MPKHKLTSILYKYMPGPAVGFCVDLWDEHKFDFKVTRKRITKLGDYRYYYATKRHCITVNGDLNPYSFLITYLHEVAHLKANIMYGRKIKPHGQEWKNIFQQLLLPVINIFPETILTPLENYIRNPKASSCGDIGLLKALLAFDKEESEPIIFLSDIQPGQSFVFNHKVYVKEEKRRTRALCREMRSGRKYLISEGAGVSLPES